MKRVMIYIEGEGGGQSPASRRHRDSDFRQAWGSFLEPLAQVAHQKGILGGFQCIAGKGGETAIDRFLHALPNDRDALRILIVDSEKPVIDINKPWLALGRKCPVWADDDNCYLMVQCLETWLLADVDALRSYYNRPKPCFRDNKLPKWSDLEKVDRKALQSALEQATADSPKAYKHADGNILIAVVDRSKLQQRLPSVRRLFTVMEQKLDVYAQS